MKKQLFLSSALALVALASCGNNSKGGLKVGLICLHDKASTYDKNFITAFEASCKEAKQKGYIADYKYVTDVEEEGSPCTEAAERFVNQGYSIIFSDSFGHDDNMAEVAAKHKNVFFSSATGVAANAKPDEMPNFHNAFASIYEGRYLAGYAAGLYLQQNPEYEDKDGKEIPLGYVGAYAYAEVISGFTSWYLGVKSAYTHAKVTMTVRFTDSWYDEVGEGNAATALIDTNHCVLISQHADSMGAPNVCAEKGVPNVSYNMNTAEMSDVCKDTYIAHSRINWKPYYDAVLQTAVGTKLPDEVRNNWTGSLSTGSVEYNVSNLVNENNREKVKAKAKDLTEGKINIFDTNSLEFKPVTEQPYKSETAEITIGDDGKLTKYSDDVNGDGLLEELVADGKFKESEFRSAPSFDLLLKNINVAK